MSSLLVQHPVRIAKAVATNVLAGVAPAWYSRWTGETGRGRQVMSARETADYFIDCVRDYRTRLDLDQDELSGFLVGKSIVEYGPGDIPGVAILLAGLGAGSVRLVDRFPLVRVSEFNREVLGLLVDSLQGKQRDRAAKALADFIGSNGAQGCITYRVSRDGTCGLNSEVDLLISRAVLEHVGDLEATFADMRRALKSGGVAIHQVDLKSHGMHIDNPLDFLVWPDWLWHAMYCNKGAPNRIRSSRYVELAKRQGLSITHFESILQADDSDWAGVAARLPSGFRALEKDDVCCLGFWMMLRAE